MMNFILKKMNFILTMMDLTLKMMNFIGAAAGNPDPSKVTAAQEARAKRSMQGLMQRCDLG